VAVEDSPRTLRLLSYNIQSGLTTRRYSHYVTKVWKHVMPVPSRMQNLNAIADLVSGYDVVGLQEVDSGSLRSGFVDQAHYLADRARFQYFCEQTNRRIGRISQHSNVLLTQIKPDLFHDYKLPGAIRGRGALMVRFGGESDANDTALYVYVVHLALGRDARRRQMAYLAKRIREQRHVVLMGDLNCPTESRDMVRFREHARLLEPIAGLHTFPSWKPKRQLDHILVTRDLTVSSVEVLEQFYSDHLPIEMELQLPPEINLDPFAELPTSESN
jgi:endonuclease/exonuclease/phosphatase family metal-dependent hydrolase